ncbi:MAG TPA: hypothetical protein VFR02_00365 [bacterium]|nr:hypothetical protein [bacterium]
MRAFRWGFGTFLAVVILGLGAFSQEGCGSSPSSPGGNSAGIVWYSGQVLTGTYSGPGANISLRVNDSPVSDATVVLSGGFPESPVTLGYVTTETDSGKDYAVYVTHSFTYVPGAGYTIASMSSALTASAGIVAPGGATFLSDASGVVTQVGEAHPGDTGNLYIMDGSGNSVLSNLSGPYPIDLVDPTTYGGSSGTAYLLDANTESSTSTLTGGTMEYGLTAEEDDYQPVTLP